MRGEEALAAAGRAFSGRLACVGAGDWTRATPCVGWTVRDLVNHVVGGNLRYAMILAGEGPDTVLAAHDRQWLGDDPMAAFHSSLERVMAAFAASGALAATVVHPRSGTMSGAQLRVLRVNELTVHAWDVAQAVGADDVLDEELVIWLYERLEPWRPSFGRSGLYAPSPEAVDPAATTQVRLLELVGRGSRAPRPSGDGDSP